MENAPIFEFVLSELEARRGDWGRIATENDLTYSWLTKLAQRRIPDPSVNKIQRLADYFRQQSTGQYV